MAEESTPKKPRTKTAKPRTAKKAARKSGKKQVKVTPTSLVITLDAAQKRKAQKCLRETGRITLGFQEVEVTKLGDLVNAAVIVN